MQFYMQDAVVNNERYRSVFIYQFQYINIYMDSEKIINIIKKGQKIKIITGVLHYAL